MHMKKATLILAVCALAGLGGCAERVNMQAGAQLATDKTCITCHGLDGQGISPMFPNIGGQWERYLANQLRDYRDGTRENAIMNGLAADLTDAEIELLSAYYAAQ
jgi:cytochrome c553